jgi:integrase
MSALVSTWLKNYPSKETRRRYEFALSQFCKFHQVTPAKTLKWSVIEAEDRLIAWKNQLVEEGKAGSSIKVNFTVIKQWFRTNRIRVDVQCKNVSTTRTYLDYLPTRDDVQRLLDTSKLHHRVIIALIAFSGLRPVDVASLQYLHIKKSFEAGDEVLTIEKKHSKTQEWYPTFLGFQGTRYLRSYLQEREEKGEKITDSTHIIISRKDDKATPVTVHGVTAAVRRAIERTIGKHPAGDKQRLFRPYGLRKYFRRTVGQLGESVAEYLMGHKKGLESLSATYSGLRDLDPKAINDLKQRYIEILPELETEITDQALRLQIKDMELSREKNQSELEERMVLLEQQLEEQRKFSLELSSHFSENLTPEELFKVLWTHKKDKQKESSKSDSEKRREREEYLEGLRSLVEEEEDPPYSDTERSYLLSIKKEAEKELAEERAKKSKKKKKSKKPS